MIPNNYEVEGQMSIFDLLDRDSWSGKTSQEPSQAENRREQTSKQSSRKSSKSSVQTLPMCLCLRREDGANQDASTMNWADGALLGEYMMHSFGESPREENASHLSQILQDSAPQKYYLSAKACTGILNRAAKRGKELPEILKQALENQIKAMESSTYDTNVGNAEN